jgi:predicted dehydrogenase
MAEGEQPLKFAVIGLGYWGPNVLRVLSDNPGIDVRWICDLDEQRLERLARRYPSARATRDFDDLLADDELEVIVIATPVFTHVELCTRALLAGKHTFVEKPLATSSALADELVTLAAVQRRALMCGHTFLYSPAVRAVRQMLDDGALGKVYFISASRVNLGLHQPDISVIWDLGPHDFSILLHWLGEMPCSVRAIGRDSIVRGIADVAFIALTFPSGIVANVELSWLAPTKLRRTVVVGSEKMVVYDDVSAEPIRLFDHGVVYQDPETFGQYHLAYRTGDIVTPRLESYEPLYAELDDFAAAIRAGDSLLHHNALARNVVRITEAADQSLRARGDEVVIDDPQPELRPPLVEPTKVA